MTKEIWIAIIGAVGVIVATVIKVVFSYLKHHKKREFVDIVLYGDQIGIRACDGNYFQVKLDIGTRLFALERHIKNWELLEIVAASRPFSITPNRAVHYGDKIALKAMNNNNFIGANLNSEQKEITANVAHIKEWETFILRHPTNWLKTIFHTKVRYGDFFALRAYNNKHITYNRDGDKGLFASVSHIQEWEIFSVIKPSQPK